MKPDPAAPRVEQECPNCGIAHSDGSKCAALDPLEDGRREHARIAEILFDLFRAAPIPCEVNGQSGTAAFFTRDQQKAQAARMVGQIWQAAWTARAARERELREALQALLQNAEHVVCIGQDCFRCFVGSTAEAALSETQPQERK